MAKATLASTPRLPPHRRRKRRVIALAVALFLGSTTWAIAEYPVIDQAAIAKASEQLAEAKRQLDVALQQLTTLKDQLSFLTKIRETVDNTFKAIGSMASITLPIANLTKLKGTIDSSLGCLPDPKNLIPDVDFKDVDFGSLCGARTGFSQSLILNPDEMRKLPVDEQNQKRRIVRDRRDKLHANAAIEALSMGTISGKDSVAAINRTADELQVSATSAKTVNDRLALIAQIELAQLRAQADLLSIQAAALRLSAAAEIKRGISSDTELPAPAQTP